MAAGSARVTVQIAMLATCTTHSLVAHISVCGSQFFSPLMCVPLCLVVPGIAANRFGIGSLIELSFGPHSKLRSGRRVRRFFPFLILINSPSVLVLFICRLYLYCRLSAPLTTNWPLPRFGSFTPGSHYWIVKAELFMRLTFRRRLTCS